MEKTLANKRIPDISSFGLHLLAMALMLCDHIWATLPYAPMLLTALGRVAFPIFAFLMAEGHAHTRDVKQYRKRLLLLAAVTEIPFNLMCSGSIIYPFHQNVIWTFLLASVCIGFIERARSRKTPRAWLAAAAMTLLGYLAGYVLFVDYHGEGVLMVLVFWLFRGSRWWHYPVQAACLYWINVEMLKGVTVELLLPGGGSMDLLLQSLALLALIPIWLYRGRQGLHGKAVKIFNYAFYPVHMLILWLIAMVTTF